VRGDDVFDRRLCCRNDAVAPGLTPSHDPTVGLDPNDEHVVGGPRFVAKSNVVRSGAERNFQNDRLDRFDSWIIAGLSTLLLRGSSNGSMNAPSGLIAHLKRVLPDRAQ
jgi:hypothetical protein